MPHLLAIPRVPWSHYTEILGICFLFPQLFSGSILVCLAFDDKQNILPVSNNFGRGCLFGGIEPETVLYEMAAHMTVAETVPSFIYGLAPMTL